MSAPNFPEESESSGDMLDRLIAACDDLRNGVLLGPSSLDGFGAMSEQYLLLGLAQLEAAKASFSIAQMHHTAGLAARY